MSPKVAALLQAKLTGTQINEAIRQKVPFFIPQEHKIPA